MWAGEVAMQKSIPASRQADFEYVSYLHRIQKSDSNKTYVVISR